MTDGSMKEIIINDDNLFLSQLVVGKVNRSDLPELDKSKFLFPATAQGKPIHCKQSLR